MIDICLLVPTGSCTRLSLNSSVFESWFCCRWMISLELELDFSCAQVMICSYIISPLGADVLQASSKGTGYTDVINLVLCLMVW